MVHPVRLNITFARIPYSPDHVYVGLNPLLLLIDAMQRVDAVQLKMSSFRLEHAFISNEVLQSVSAHSMSMNAVLVSVFLP